MWLLGGGREEWRKGNKDGEEELGGDGESIRLL